MKKKLLAKLISCCLLYKKKTLITAHYKNHSIAFKDEETWKHANHIKEIA